MNTPPRLRRSRPKTPNAPRLGPLFSSPSPGRKRKAASSVSNYSTATISPPPSSPLAPRSVERKSTSKKRTSRAVSEEPADASSSSSEESDEDGEEKAEEGKATESGKDDDDEIERILGQSRRTLLNPGGFGLPTPAKTPSRKRKHIELEEIAGSARVLFAPPGASSSATRSSARRSLFSRTPRQGKRRLDLLGDDPGASDSISIFTDSNARIPKLDVDPNNPFITRPGGEGSSSKRKSNRKKAPPLGEDEKRTDGMVYVFRGKKIFKKFAEIDDPDERVPGHLDDGSPEEISLDRSSIRPRLLFPPKKLEEEEAETDIDDSALGTRPANSFEEGVATKKKHEAPPEKRDISRMTPESEEESTGGQYNMFNKGPTTRGSIPGAGSDEVRARGSPAKGPRVKRGLEVESKLTSPRKLRGKRARV